MIGKTDWTEYLHEIRRQELAKVFSLMPVTNFAHGLEIGAGDGYQASRLATHVAKLISSDLNFKRIKEKWKVPGVVYQIIDADQIAGVFQAGQFDLIFSSNVLEHLQNPAKFLADTCPLLAPNGYAVHIVPSRLIKIFYLLFYYPNLAVLALDRLLGKLAGRAFFQGADIALENNINRGAVKPKRISGRLSKFIWPSPHGNFPNHRAEFSAFGRRRWERLFHDAGYKVVSYARGPLFSGYGFGWRTPRRWLERLGLSSEHTFILQAMSSFESRARAYTKAALPRASDYEHEKFVGDWLKKGKNAAAFVADFKRQVGDPSGRKILDVGFGNGLMLAAFARSGAKAYGLETESSLLKLAEAQFLTDGLNATLKVYDGRTFPFLDNYFDYCYSTSVLEHMSYPAEVLREIARVLVPGGRFYLSFPNKYALKESHTGLWLISWLPRPLTQFILRLTGSSPLEDWNLHFISYFLLKKWARLAGLRIVYATESRSRWRRGLKRGLAAIGVHYGILLKTIIIVLEKPLNHGSD